MNLTGDTSIPRYDSSFENNRFVQSQVESSEPSYQRTPASNQLNEEIDFQLTKTQNNDISPLVLMPYEAGAKDQNFSRVLGDPDSIQPFENYL